MRGMMTRRKMGMKMMAKMAKAMAATMHTRMQMVLRRFGCGVTILRRRHQAAIGMASPHPIHIIYPFLLIISSSLPIHCSKLHPSRPPMSSILSIHAIVPSAVPSFHSLNNQFVHSAVWFFLCSLSALLLRECICLMRNLKSISSFSLEWRGIMRRDEVLKKN
ncbi:hypothetical protein BC829DRAFT_395012 [Chytridium lagenaria]|nr:hypothetical protein BC829DRAFT_395012 [Chytridium lagenaria]